MVPGVTTPLAIPVRQLVEFACRSGDLAAGVPGPTASAGLRGHQQLQRSPPPGYRPEVRLSATVALDEFQVELKGRVDLMCAEGEPPAIEEIKTCLVPPDRLPDAQVALHWAQLKVYGFCHLHASGGARIRLQLTWYDLATGRSYADAEELAYDALRDFTLAALQRYLAWQRLMQHHRRQLRAAAGALRFPFGAFRAGQRAMAADIYRAARDGGQCLIEAPTGTGKTISALFAAAKALGEGHVDRILYLTAKNSGRLAAADMVAALVRGGLPAGSLLIRAKAQACPCHTGACERDAEGRCPRGLGFYDRLPPARERLLALGTMDAAAIDAVALEYQLCPFELALQMAPWADIVICDFNYVFDPLVELSCLRDDGARALLLVDEVHNLVDRSRQMYSAQLCRSDLDACARACRHDHPALSKALRRVASAMLRWHGSAATAPAIGRAAPAAVSRAVDRLLQGLATAADDPYPEPLTEVLRALYRFAAIAALFGAHHTCIARAGARGDSRGDSRGAYRDVEVKLLCLDASEYLAHSYQSFQAVAAFSATLSPADYYRRALGLHHDTPARILPSPFAPQQLGVWLYPAIDTRQHQREHHLGAIARAIGAVYAARPGNYLAFFPSYRFMQQVAEAFTAMFETPRPLLQERATDEAQRRAFLDQFECGRPTLGFAIMGGVFGEGVDYAGDRLIGAIVVGVGLPAADTEQELIRAEYAAAGIDGFDFAYRFPGLARVMQAAGRVIRSERDRGVVVLMDRRFGHHQYRRHLPRYWHPRRCSDPSTLQGELQAFWQEAPPAPNNS